MTPLEDLLYVDLPESWLDEDHRLSQRMQSCFEELADAKKQTGMGSKIKEISRAFRSSKSSRQLSN